MSRTVTVELPPHTSIVFVDDTFLPFRVWSEPMQMMIEPGRHPDVVELTMKPYVPPEYDDIE